MSPVLVGCSMGARERLDRSGAQGTGAAVVDVEGHQLRLLAYGPVVPVAPVVAVLAIAQGADREEDLLAGLVRWLLPGPADMTAKEMLHR